MIVVLTLFLSLILLKWHNGPSGADRSLSELQPDPAFQDNGSPILGRPLQNKTPQPAVVPLLPLSWRSLALFSILQYLAPAAVGGVGKETLMWS